MTTSGSMWFTQGVNRPAWPVICSLINLLLTAYPGLSPQLSWDEGWLPPVTHPQWTASLRCARLFTTEHYNWNFSFTAPHNHINLCHLCVWSLPINSDVPDACLLLHKVSVAFPSFSIALCVFSNLKVPSCEEVNLPVYNLQACQWIRSMDNEF